MIHKGCGQVESLSFGAKNFLTKSINMELNGFIWKTEKVSHNSGARMYGRVGAGVVWSWVGTLTSLIAGYLLRPGFVVDPTNKSA